MDRFPQYPPHDDTGAEIPETVEFLAWIGILTTAWVLALLAVGYWIAGAAPSAGSYIHGVMVGILVGMTLILAVVTRKPKRISARTVTTEKPRQSPADDRGRP